MAQRCVVTEQADGRSRFASDDEPAKLTLIESVLWSDQLWTTTDAPLRLRTVSHAELREERRLWVIAKRPTACVLRWRR